MCGMNNDKDFTVSDTFLIDHYTSDVKIMI